ncbi:sentrin-specific protease 6 isoform X2 [Dendrobates tinctorius]|uniref:sentrin-specific protease 6 isoform X2 n=1 Tax=Dendrobates tinctorius TaxID=92724 RepID=UPI003CC9BF32
MAGGGESRFLEALDRAQSKKDAGFRNNWSFENLSETEDIVEKDEVNLLTIDDDDDGVNSKPAEQKSGQLRSRTIHGTGDSYRTYEKRGKSLYLRPSKGNATGMNMLGASKKLGENAQNIPHSQGTMVQGRLFHHINITQTGLKTAAQSLERRERKEYPPHVQKVDIDAVRVSEILEDMQGTEEDPEMEPEPIIRRKVQQMRNSSFHTCLSTTESTGQLEPAQHCISCVKENKSKTRCQSCGDAQRLCGQSTSSSESPASLARPSIHQSAARDKSNNHLLNTKNFYGSAYRNNKMDPLINDCPRWKQCPANGKIGLSTEASLSKITKNAKVRSSRLAETSDPIILSSDDEDNVSTGSTSRIESISPRPADSACSSPVPSSGKVEAALRENRLGDNKYNNPAEPEPPVNIPRKARMKDQFGNSVATTPIKRRKISQMPSDSTNMLPYTVKSCESMIVLCRNLRIGTLCRIIKEPVVFCVDHIKIVLEALNDEDGFELILPTSELTKCEWCSARKLPVVYFQSTPGLCNKLRSQFQMSRENEAGWYDCNSTSIAEQYIVLIFDRPLEAHEIVCFERIQSEVGEKQLIPNFFSKMSFDEANRRLVASTNHGTETPSAASTPKDHITRSATSETRMKLRNTTPHLQFFEDEEEEVDTHTVFVGPIVKLFVYPPPPAKGGISVTNEDLHCLNEGEFLNDVIIDFYLKYLVLEKLREKADKIHIFSSFFYKRLNQRERRNLQDTANLTLQQRRHGRVKTWTRHVDIFQKDFIFVPLNEAAHWFLAVICFPGLNEPMYYPNEYYRETSSPSTAAAQADDDRTSAPAELQTCLQSGSSKSPPKKSSSKKQTLTSGNTSSGSEDGDSPGNKRHSLRKNDQGLQESDTSLKTPFPQMDCSSKNVNGITSDCKTPLKQADGLRRIKLSYSDSPDDLKKSEEELIDSDQDNLDESSDDGCLADDNFTSEAGKWHLKSSFCKQPCILLMDSLRGPSRSNVVKTLREYLEVEWEVKKGSKRSFSKDYMKGSNPRVPQQNNFSDCGVFVLQYVESFFENPIQSFDLPMNLTNWFPQQRMKTKREEIRTLILGLQELQSKDKTGQRDLGITQPTPQEGAEQLIREFDSV